ncbi:hypothetical protein Pan14r_23790 [Crateriforma conspicua]|uniref:BioF2-like acetyltransferase domain-containing protein n=2 Tax=Crateriforma conspicua TaxID=2527996 RepID=A0A5C5Y5Z2_9PLAN|nr:hypothetical protein Pan14r_23790 [Crateriforma conspicua]
MDGRPAIHGFASNDHGTAFMPDTVSEISTTRFAASHALPSGQGESQDSSSNRHPTVPAGRWTVASVDNGQTPSIAAATTTPIAVRCLSLDELDPQAIDSWSQLREGRPEFQSPFFSHRFAQAVQRARGDVQVAVASQRNRIVGVLPFHRRGRVAYPVGRFFNDAHQLITASDVTVDWIDLLRQLSLRSFDAHAMTGVNDRDRDRFRMRTVRSFACELGDDSRGYLKRLGRDHKTIGRQPQKTRKMQREVGTVRWELDCRDPAVLDQVIAWKRDQYRRTHILDLFKPDWTRRMIGDLHSDLGSNAADFGRCSSRGLLSVLWVDGRPAAGHFGMIESGRLHYWFPAYDPALGRYSPGTALFRGIIEAASDHGITMIDMGYGEQPYKRKQTDAVTEVSAGCISRCKVHRAYRFLERMVVHAAQSIPMKESVKRIVRATTPDAGIGKLR